jgi:hypothetical protein
MQRRQVMPTRSYLSQVELPVTFGLGSHDLPVSIRIIWPDGRVQTVDDLTVDKIHVIHQSPPGDVS